MLSLLARGRSQHTQHTDNMAAPVTISAEEKAYLFSGIQQNLRTDGRTCSDYNPFALKTGVLNRVSGSAEVKLGSTHVFVTLKAEIENELDYLPDNPNEGNIQFYLERWVYLGEDVSEQNLRETMQLMIQTETFDLASLAVIPGEVCWVLNITFEVFECGGNLYDALSFAIKAALYNTELPNLKITGEGDEMEFMIPDDPYDGCKVDVSRVPLIVTVNKIGNRLVLDLTAEEAACCDAKLVVAVDSSGGICGVQKKGKEGINPDLTSEMIEMAKKAGKKLNENLMNALHQEKMDREREQSTAT